MESVKIGYLIKSVFISNANGEYQDLHLQIKYLSNALVMFKHCLSSLKNIK